MMYADDPHDLEPDETRPVPMRKVEMHYLEIEEEEEDPDSKEGEDGNKQSSDSDSTGSTESFQTNTTGDYDEEENLTDVAIGRTNENLYSDPEHEYSDPLVRDAAKRLRLREEEKKRAMEIQQDSFKRHSFVYSQGMTQVLEEEEGIKVKKQTFMGVVTALQNKYEQIARQYRYDGHVEAQGSNATTRDAARYGYRFGTGGNADLENQPKQKYGPFGKDDQPESPKSKGIKNLKKLGAEEQNRWLLQLIWLGLTMTLITMMMMSASESGRSALRSHIPTVPNGTDFTIAPTMEGTIVDDHDHEVPPPPPPMDSESTEPKDGDDEDTKTPHSHVPRGPNQKPKKGSNISDLRHKWETKEHNHQKEEEDLDTLEETLDQLDQDLEVIKSNDEGPDSVEEGEIKEIEDEVESLTEVIDEESEEFTENEKSDSSDDPLPPGWIEKVNPRTGNVYYYNQEKHATSNTRPIDSSSSDSESDSKSSSSDNPFYKNWWKSESSSESSSGDSKSSSSDSSESTPFYKNWWKSESSSESSSSDSTSSDSSSSDDLPPGWVERKNPRTGKTYYYNQETHVTSNIYPVDSSSNSRGKKEEEKKN